MITKDEIRNNLDIMFPHPLCELNYTKDYELLIATVLSAQSTDKSVNIATAVLFGKYNIFDLVNVPTKEIENIIKKVGTYTKKALFIKEISKSLVSEHNGVVPNDREYLESLPGVGRKTCNVVLSILFEEPTIAVDTHVSRVSVRLGLADADDSLRVIEYKIGNTFPKKEWNRINLQLVLFGRYICKSIKPNCSECLFNNKCKIYNFDKEKITSK